MRTKIVSTPMLYWYRLRRFLKGFFSWIYVYYIAAAWIIARFNAAWVEYQKYDIYRERLAGMGFQYAYDAFRDNKLEQRYHLKRRLSKEPALRWRIWFAPFSVPIPEDLVIASRQGYFNE